MSTSGEHGYPDTGHTRTHLPEGDPYGGAPRRGPRSSSRSLVMVVGVVVLLIAAIAFANRDNSPSDKAPAQGAPDNNAAAPTAATGQSPVPTTQNGIPTNFPHTKQGAESAAANYAVALGSAEMFDKARRDSVLQTVMTPSRVTSSKTEMDQAYTPAFNESLGLSASGAAPKGSTFVSRTSPIGTKVTESGDDTATVAVWCSGLLGLAGNKSTNPVTNSWFTITMKLQWAAGDWKIITHSQKEGPAPVPGDDRASDADDMSKTVEEYGGFTYAR